MVVLVNKVVMRYLRLFVLVHVADVRALFARHLVRIERAIRALDVAMYGRLSCAALVGKYAAVCVMSVAAAAVFRALLPRFHSFAFGGR